MGSVFLLACFSTAPAWASGGKIKVSFKDAGGHVINGSAKATMDGTTRSCRTGAGTCTLGDLAPGTWTVTAHSPSGRPMGGPKDAAVLAGKTVTLNMRVQTGAPAAKTLTEETTPQDGKPTTAKTKSAPTLADKSAAVNKKNQGARKIDTKALKKGKKKHRNLAVGKKQSVTGTIRNTKGHRLNGKIVVKKVAKKKTKVIGSAKTGAGSYRLYDLAPGTYILVFETASGPKAYRRVKVKKDKKVTINFKVKQ